MNTNIDPDLSNNELEIIKKSSRWVKLLDVLAKQHPMVNRETLCLVLLLVIHHSNGFAFLDLDASSTPTDQDTLQK